MKPTRIKAVTKKEFIQIVRDPRSLGMAVAIPMLMLILFGYALTLDVDNVPLVIWDQDKSQLAHDFILNFKGSPYFKIVGYFDDYKMLDEYINTNRAMMAMVIPRDFSHLVESGQAAPVQLLVDGSDSATATIAIGYANAITAKYNRGLISESFAKAGIKISPPLDMRSRVWFNPDLKSRNFIIPGLIAVIMMVIAAMLTSLTVAREWERGTMEQLISTPVKSGELILGKFIPYFAIGILDVLIAVAMGEFLFHIPLRGSVLLLLAMTAFFLTGALSLGMVFSIVTKNQLMASQLAMVTTFLPAFLLSGFVYAIPNMPKVIQAITYLIPARYFVTVVKGIYLKGVGLRVLGMQAVFLIVFSLAAFLLAYEKFRKKVA
jgi:ABC-2 type transport system permease protein